MRKTPKYQPSNVEVEKIAPVLKELIDRCGSPEQAAEYAGIGTSSVYRIVYKEYRTVHQRTARLIILALHERRREDRRNGSSERFQQARKYQAELEKKMNDTMGY